jgi:Mg2+ and Co2+ transporter CorA
MIDLEDFKPRRKTPYEVILDSAEDEFAEPHERSIFDTIVKIHNDSSLTVTSDPFSATFFARNCIRAVWERQVCENDWEVSDIVNDDGRFHLTRQSANAFEDFEKKMAADNQNVETYQKLMQKRYMINSHRRHIRTITEKFRLRDTDYLSTGTPEFQNTSKEEAKLWMSLDERLQDMEEVICDHMNMYSARSAMEETYEAKMQSWESMRQTEEANRQTAAANRMARSSGQLTKIATIVVPCTFVASIFSMGGDFAAGESLFYVYWIISVPITLGLFYWVVHDDISDTMRKSKEWINWKGVSWKRKAFSEVSIV